MITQETKSLSKVGTSEIKEQYYKAFKEKNKGKKYIGNCDAFKITIFSVSLNTDMK